jgi:hypothetical protein
VKYFIIQKPFSKLTTKSPILFHSILDKTHVNDLLRIALSGQILGGIGHKIECHVGLKKRGKLTKMLRVEIKWIEYGIIQTQRNLIEIIIEGYGIAEEKLLLPIDRSWFEVRDNTSR